MMVHDLLVRASSHGVPSQSMQSRPLRAHGSCGFPSPKSVPQVMTWASTWQHSSEVGLVFNIGSSKKLDPTLNAGLVVDMCT